MSAITVPRQVIRSRAARPHAPLRVSRQRRNVAGALDLALQPALAMRRGLRSGPRVPRANRTAVAEPLAEIAALLRDPEVAVSDDAARRVFALATNPTSALYGQHPNRAGFVVWSLLAELRGHAGYSS
jgi:hypothetical protein